MKYALLSRSYIEVNTDPQRRCYNGVLAQSEMRWTPWKTVCTYASKADAQESLNTFKQINPDREYKIEGSNV